MPIYPFHTQEPYATHKTNGKSIPDVLQGKGSTHLCPNGRIPYGRYGDTHQKWRPQGCHQEPVSPEKAVGSKPVMKKFTFEYDMSKELIIRSLCGKSNITTKDLQNLFTVLINKAYEINKGKAVI